MRQFLILDLSQSVGLNTFKSSSVSVLCYRKAYNKIKGKKMILPVLLMKNFGTGNDFPAELQIVDEYKTPLFPFSRSKVISNQLSILITVQGLGFQEIHLPIDVFTCPMQSVICQCSNVNCRYRDNIQTKQKKLLHRKRISSADPCVTSKPSQDKRASVRRASVNHSLSEGNDFSLHLLGRINSLSL